MAKLAYEDFEKEKLILTEEMPGDIVVFGKGQGKLQYGQAIAQNYTTGIWKKYNPEGSDGTENPRRVYREEEEIDTDTAESDINIATFRKGRLDRTYVKGIAADDYEGLAKLETNGIILETTL